MATSVLLTAIYSDQLRALNPELDAHNLSILEQRADAHWQRSVPQTGDFVQMPDGTLRRLTDEWGDEVYTTCAKNTEHDSFYLSVTRVCFSGATDARVAKRNLHDTGGFRVGTFWIFRNDQARPHNDLVVQMPCRVWTLQS